MTNFLSFQDIISVLGERPELFANHTPMYRLTDFATQQFVQGTDLAKQEGALVDFGPFGQIHFPLVTMGAISTLHLFGLDELVIFAFYERNRTRYKKALDIGANLGLHSLVMSRCGFEVTAYEPDPHHFALLQKNLINNKCDRVTPVQAAVSKTEGEAEFVRVLGNTTSSHLAGAKSNPYGKLERYPVKVVEFAKIVQSCDLVKIDAEGHECEILLSVPVETWETRDVMMEIGSPENAARIHEFMHKSPINIFVQKLGWKKAATLADLPTSHRDGSAFITAREAVPW